MEKIRLYIKDTEDTFKFKTLEELLLFINELTVEKLIDSNYTELNYVVIVEE